MSYEVRIVIIAMNGQGKRIKIQVHYECRRHATPAKPRVE